MNLGEDVDLEDYVNRPEKISAADIAAIAQEAGLQVTYYTYPSILFVSINLSIDMYSFQRAASFLPSKTPI